MSEEPLVKGKADFMDNHIGRRLKMRRILLGLSQRDLGEAVNVSIQQIQKYEKATNRIAGGKLFSFAKLLKVPIEYFFDATEDYSPISAFAEEQAAFETEDTSASERELLTLVRSYNDIKDNSLRKKVLDLVKSLSHSNV